jgi:cell wall-associated NlpC family hydrolase
LRQTRSVLRVAQLRRPLLVAAVLSGALAVLAPASAAQAEPSLDSIEQQIDAKSKSLEKVVEQYNKVNEELKATQRQAAAVSAKIKPLQAELTTANARVSSIAVQAFKGGDMAAVGSLLESGSPEVMVTRLTTIDQIVRRQQQDIDRYQTAKDNHAVEAAKLSGILADQTKKRDDLAAQRKKINKELSALNQMRNEAYGAVLNSAGSGAGAVPPYVAGKAGKAVRFAYGALGTPYVWAGEGPGGYDCSGLTLAAWRAAGVSLPHNAAMQYNQLAHISRSQLRPGDLVFYSGLGHVGIFVGNGQIIHAPTFGEVVKLSSVDVMPPYGYARVG